MRIWLITVGEPLPTDGENVRLHRAGIMARQFSAMGHRVVWWTSTLDHWTKKHRFDRDTVVDLNERLRLRQLHAIAYHRNVSVRRILNHCELARKFAAQADLEERPDVILCSLPTLELCAAASAYGKRRGVPVVLDVRDLWPDLMLELLPAWVRPAGRLALAPMFRTVRSACEGATAITGITPQFVEWGLGYARRPRGRWDREFPMGYSAATPSPAALEKARAFWEAHGVTGTTGGGEFIACFFGTFGRQFDLETVIAAAERLARQNRSVRFVLCGTGDRLEHYKQLAANCPNLIFPGWVGAAEIWTLSRMASVGLAPYYSNPNFVTNMPNKPIEYLSAGLPLISSLDGSLKELLATHNCGLSYKNGNAAELESLITVLLDHPERLAEMSKNALALYQERYVAETVYGNMCRYLEELAAAEKERCKA